MSRTSLALRAVAVLSLVATREAPAQETAGAEAPRNTITVSIGRSSGVDQGPKGFVRALGSDYMRRVSERWEVGVQLDLDFVPDDGDGAEAFIVTPVVAYALTERWPMFVGAGVAFEHDGHTKGFGRIGTEYMFKLDARWRWFIAPGGFVDVGEEVTPSLMIAVGHNF